MTIKLPLSCISSGIKSKNQGTVIVASLPAPPPMGGGTFDGTTWTLSNKTAAGWPTDWERDLQAGDVVAVTTATGSQLATIQTIVAGADETVITVTQDAVGGSLMAGQATGVWKEVAAAFPCSV